MIFEKLDTQLDILKLREHLQKFVLNLPIIQQSPSFGGWSVLSSNGSYRDGWEMGHVALSNTMSPEQIVECMKTTGIQPIWNYVVPTEICHGYLLEVIHHFRKMKLPPARARIIRLSPHSGSSWHRDCPDNVYKARLHVPIETNPRCTFEVEGEGVGHMPADGSSYFVQVNRIHRVFNDSDLYRYHLVMDVRDYLGVSQFHGHIESE